MKTAYKPAARIAGASKLIVLAATAPIWNFLRLT
jgi:hypothetical protein